jgi:23S rRNA (guanine745-N1)-methyltransferase
MLRCPVRGCGLELARHDRAWVCPARHAFDLARSGYINLLQPQDRKSKEPGDAAAAVAARRRLHDLGITRPLYRAIADLARVASPDAVLDAGCGEGFYLGSLQAETGCAAWGVDLSNVAVDAAARRYPACSWIVANADRPLPFAGASFSLILSITGRMNIEEFHRLLPPGGRVLVALAAADDLIELRGPGRDRVARTITDFEGGAFRLAGQGIARTVAELDDAGMRDILAAIYRPLRAAPVSAGPVTLSLDLLSFEK